jgi:hypothetical protein
MKVLLHGDAQCNMHCKLTSSARCPTNEQRGTAQKYLVACDTTLPITKGGKVELYPAENLGFVVLQVFTDLMTIICQKKGTCNLLPTDTSIAQARRTIFDKRPHPLLCAGSRAARRKITSGIPNSLNYFPISHTYTHTHTHTQRVEPPL